MSPKKIRPLTKALFEANSKRLIKRGYRLEEQRQIFKKADELLDYIAEYTDLPIVQKNGLDNRVIKSDFKTGLKAHLSKNMPSLKKQGLALEVLDTLLSIGHEMVIRAAWIYRNYPVIYGKNYASSVAAYHKDSHFFMMKGHTIPTHSFITFKTGENPAFSRDDDFAKRCIHMYNDPLFETTKFLEYEKTTKTVKDYYIQWLHSTKAGKHFGDLDYALSHNIMNDLLLENAVESKINKSCASQNLARKKQQKTK